MGENSGLHSARSFPSAYELLSLACGHVTSVYSISATLTINITSAVVKVGHMESRWVHQHLDHEMYTENPGHAAMFSLASLFPLLLRLHHLLSLYLPLAKVITSCVFP